MSYPYDSPSLSMNTTWNSGSYTPDSVVKNIRDNYTPINKNSVRNSVGNQISLIENFVNSKYLGRSDISIESGFITNLLSENLITDYVSINETATIKKLNITETGFLQNAYVYNDAYISGNLSVDLTGYIDDLLVYDTLIVGSGATGGTGIKLYGTSNSLNYIKARPVGGGTPANLYISVGDTPAISINEDSDVKIYDRLSVSSNDINYNLNVDGSGEIKDELIIATNNGNTGIRIYGDQSAFNYIKAIPQGGGTPATLNISVGETIAISINESGWTRVGAEFGCNNVAPSGKHPLLTVGTTLGSLLTWASGVNSLLQNFGFMADS